MRRSRMMLLSMCVAAATGALQCAAAGQSPWPATPPDTRTAPAGPDAQNPDTRNKDQDKEQRPAQAPLKAMYGRSEYVLIGDQPPLRITANLTENQPGSVIYATGIGYFNHDSDLWVSFVIDNGSVLPGNRTAIKRKVLKDQHLKSRGGGVLHEPLVEVEICLGSQRIPLRVNVKPRSGYTVPLVIGRADVARLGAIDPSLQFTERPECAAPAKPAATAGPSP